MLPVLSDRSIGQGPMSLEQGLLSLLRSVSVALTAFSFLSHRGSCRSHADGEQDPRWPGFRPMGEAMTV